MEDSDAQRSLLAAESRWGGEGDARFTASFPGLAPQPQGLQEGEHQPFGRLQVVMSMGLRSPWGRVTDGGVTAVSSWPLTRSAPAQGQFVAGANFSGGSPRTPAVVPWRVDPGWLVTFWGVLFTCMSLQVSDLHSSLCSCLPQSGSEFVGPPQIWVPVRGPGADGGFRVVRCPQPPHHHGREAVELG